MPKWYTVKLGEKKKLCCPGSFVVPTHRPCIYVHIYTLTVAPPPVLIYPLNAFPTGSSDVCREIADYRATPYSYPRGMHGMGHIFQLNHHPLCVCSNKLSRHPSSIHVHSNNGVLVIVCEKRVYISCLKPTCNEELKNDFENRVKTNLEQSRRVLYTQNGRKVFVELLENDLK